MIKNSISAREIAEVLGVSESAVRKRGKNAHWPVEVIPGVGRGGKNKGYIFDSLPDDVRLALSVAEQEQALAEIGCKPLDVSEFGEAVVLRGIAYAKVLRDYVHSASKATKWGKKLKAKKLFVKIYNMGEFGSHPKEYSRVGKLSFQTFERKCLELEESNGDISVLFDRRGRHRKGQTQLSDRQRQTLNIFATHPNQLNDMEIIRGAKRRMEAEGDPCPLKDRQLRYLLAAEKRRNLPQLTLGRKGEKSLNETCLFHISRDYDAIEVGDIAFADGHTYNFECLDYRTGKPKRMTLVLFYDMKSTMPLGWEIMATENTEAIKVALYRSILTLGKIPRIAYLDNGRAFRGQYFTGVKDLRDDPNVGVFELLGMRSIFAWPYHAETKPIEGFFGIMGELERLLPSYTGTSIENKPARMKRGEAIHRQLYDKLYQGKTPTIIDAHLALAHWIDTEYAVRPQRGHLKGKTPLEVFQAGKGPGLSSEEKIKLRLLMAQRHFKRIPRDGFKMPWSEERYYHCDLFGRQNQTATIRYDWQDKGSIFVYDAGGQYICEATPMRKVHPAAAYLGTEDDRAELERQIEMKNSLKKSVTGRVREFIEAEVVPQVRRQIAEVHVDAQTTEQKDSAEIDAPPSQEELAEANREFNELMAAPPVQWGPRAEVAPLLPEREFTVDWESLPSMPDLDRFELLLECEAREVRTPMSEKRWMSMFEKSEAYDRLRHYFEDTALKFRLLYGAESTRGRVVVHSAEGGDS